MVKSLVLCDCGLQLTQHAVDKMRVLDNDGDFLKQLLVAHLGLLNTFRGEIVLPVAVVFHHFWGQSVGFQGQVALGCP